MTRILKVAGLLAFTSITRGHIGVVLLTILILVLVALNLFFVPSLLRGLVWGANDKVINTYSGDIVVESGEDNPLIENVDQLVARIEAINGVVATSPRNSIGAGLSLEDERTNCTVYGVRPEREKGVFTIHEYVIEGSYLDARDLDKILLGLQLSGSDRENIEFYSRSLRKVHAGDKITVTYNNGLQKRYTVKGIFYTEFLQTDLQAFISDREFRNVNPFTINRANSIRIKLAPNADAQWVIEQIKRLREGLRILTWEDNAGIIRSLTDSFNVINAILNVVNLLVAGITVFIVTYIDVSNRRRQIGIQRAIGITPYSITLSYLMRALFYAIVGIVLAVLAFIYGVLPLQARFPFRFPFGEAYLRIDFSHMFRIGLILLGVSVVAAFIPVRRVIRIKILDAIWG